MRRRDITERRIIRAESFGAPDVLRVERESVPPISGDEVLIAVESAGVNFADILLRRGRYRRDQVLPCVPGLEVAGWVVAAGADAKVDPGTPVVAFLEDAGGYAEYVAAPVCRTYALPEDVSPTDAATVFLQGITAWYAIHRFGQVRAGEWVLVHAGAGGVGALAIQLAKVAGASVVTTASTRERLGWALRQGADAGVLGDPVSVPDEVREVIGRPGCDVVVDGVGGPLFGASMEILARGGRYVVVGSASQEPALLDARRLIPRNQTVSGFIVARVFEEDPEEPTRTLTELFELLRQNKLRLTRTVMALEDAADAHRLIEGRRHVGKIILKP